MKNRLLKSYTVRYLLQIVYTKQSDRSDGQVDRTSASEAVDLGSIPESENVKHLGVMIDSQLNFKSHVLTIENKISRSVDMLYN